MAGKSQLEALMEAQIRSLDTGAAYVREHRFDPSRQWRFDFAWPTRKVALEVQGGTWTKGAHVRGKQFQSDCEKFNSAMLLGWRVFKVTTDHVHNGYAIDTIKEALNVEA